MIAVVWLTGDKAKGKAAESDLARSCTTQKARYLLFFLLVKSVRQ